MGVSPGGAASDTPILCTCQSTYYRVQRALLRDNQKDNQKAVP